MTTYDYYIAHSRSLSSVAKDHCNMLEEEGYVVFLPCRDVDDTMPPEPQCDNAIAASRRVICIWDTDSRGAYGDVRVAKALGVPVEGMVIIGDTGGALAFMTRLRHEIEG